MKKTYPLFMQANLTILRGKN